MSNNFKGYIEQTAKKLDDYIQQAKAKLDTIQSNQLEPEPANQKEFGLMMSLYKKSHKALTNLSQLESGEYKLALSDLDKFNSEIKLVKIAKHQKEIEQLISLIQESEESLKNLSKLNTHISQVNEENSKFLSSIKQNLEQIIKDSSKQDEFKLKLNELKGVNKELSSILNDIKKVNTKLNSKINLDKIPHQEEIEQIISLLKKYEVSLTTNLSQLKADKFELAISKLNELNSAIELVKIAIDTLIANPQMLIFVQKLRYSAEYTIDELVFPWWYSHINNPWRRFWRSTKIPSKILIGLGLGILLNIGLSVYTQRQLANNGDTKQFFKPILLSQINNSDPSAGTKSDPSAGTKSDPSAGTKSDPSAGTKSNTSAGTKSNTSAGNSQQEKLNKNPDDNLSEEEKLQNKLYNTFTGLLIWVWICGTTGSVVSIFWRVLDDKDKDSKYSDDFIPAFIGICKPLVGGISGLIIFFALESHLFPIELPVKDYQKLLSFGVIGFVSGFSERLIKDLISKTENSFSSNTTTQASQTQTNNAPVPIKIEPNKVELNYGKKQQINITPGQNFQFKLEPNLGQISKTANSITYTAPTKVEAEDKTHVKITVTSEDKHFNDVAVVIFT